MAASLSFPASDAEKVPASDEAAARGILLAVLYADVFDCALTRDELYRRLVGISLSRNAFDGLLAALAQTHLSVDGPYVTWRGREALVGIRQRRKRAAAQMWPVAQRYTRWLARVPFVRMVAVSGSLAAENAEAGSDIDFFCITEPGRLWVARLGIVPLAKLTRWLPGRFPHYLCPNYLLTLDALPLLRRDLFTAHEVAQVVLMQGRTAFVRFADANAWVGAVLPHHGLENARPGPQRATETPSALPTAGRLTRAAERLLSGRAGDLLDAASHGVFTAFYRRRAARKGWAWDRLAEAYHRDRYTVPEGGYARVVAQVYRQRVEQRLGAEALTKDLRILLPPSSPAETTCYPWPALFAAGYDRSPEAASSAPHPVHP